MQTEESSIAQRKGRWRWSNECGNAPDTAWPGQHCWKRINAICWSGHLWGELMPDNSEPDWLPPLIRLEDYSGSWDDFFSAVYQIFMEDFVQRKPIFEGRMLGLKRHPEVQPLFGTWSLKAAWRKSELQIFSGWKGFAGQLLSLSILVMVSLRFDEISAEGMKQEFCFGWKSLTIWSSWQIGAVTSCLGQHIASIESTKGENSKKSTRNTGKIREFRRSKKTKGAAIDYCDAFVTPSTAWWMS